MITQNDVQVIRISDMNRTIEREIFNNKKSRLLRVIDMSDGAHLNLDGYYIRLLDSAFKAYGDIIPECDSYGVVWLGNKITFVASDDVSAQFQYEIYIDRIVGVEVDGKLRAEGALELDRPLQEIYDSVYFPIPKDIEEFLVPVCEDKIRLELECQWLDMRTSKLWGAAGV